MASDGVLGYRANVNSPLLNERSYSKNTAALSNDEENAYTHSGMLHAAPKFATSEQHGIVDEHIQPILNPMEKLLAKLNQQNSMHQNTIQGNKPNAASAVGSHPHQPHSATTPLQTNAAFQIFEENHNPGTTSATFGNTGRSTQEDTQAAFYKAKLEAAEARIARMDQELDQSRSTTQSTGQSTRDWSIVDQSDADAAGLPNLALLNLNQGVSGFHNNNNTSMWSQTGNRHVVNNGVPSHSMDRARAIWGNSPAPSSHSLHGYQSGDQHSQDSYGSTGNGYNPQPWMTRQMANTGYMSTTPSDNAPSPYFKQDRGRGDYLMPQDNGSRGNGSYGNRSQLAYTGNGAYDGMAHAASYAAHMGLPSPASTGAQLSPFAPEFNVRDATVWNQDDKAIEDTTYLSTTEPLNYRRMLDRTVSCDWRYIVDKIVCSNDQQASIFLQQKLKVATPEQKFEIVDSIVSRAYHLMINRFGNFLVQRCFEHGTPEQVVQIAEAIRTNTLTLSMDPFGCHVVQKAFDSVPEEYKAIMVNELLRRIPETVIHRYACHVWQKLFELRWSTSPPQIMSYVNDALRGMWHDVALGETGSLVVQNIFENCLEDDKRPCIEEVLASIDIVAHGQFGNWCIQHICEHGAPADRSRAIDHVIRYATEYSTDQFASKVVEKCLKIAGVEFLDRYLARVCEGRADRPRIPLIDIASDQYGNYLVQYILTNANSQHREVVAAHIRKHMVSLRSSKFGSRVGMLCTNPAITTRPGPVTSPAMGNRLPMPAIQQQRFNSGYGR